MRRAVPGALPLFRSETQVRLLSLLLLQPERSWTLTELATALEAPTSSIHRELGRVEGAGLVVRDASSRPHRFIAAVGSPIFGPLRDLLARTVSVEDDLAQALDCPAVCAVTIHGSWTSGNRRPDSDIDVVVVGDADIRDLRRRVRPVARRVGRRIDLTLFGLEEFQTLVREGRGFVRHLAEEPTMSLIGDLQELMEA